MEVGEESCRCPSGRGEVEEMPHLQERDNKPLYAGDCGCSLLLWMYPPLGARPSGVPHHQIEGGYK
jgi:hypothetical protein